MTKFAMIEKMTLASEAFSRGRWPGQRFDHGRNHKHEQEKDRNRHDVPLDDERPSRPTQSNQLTHHQSASHLAQHQQQADEQQRNHERGNVRQTADSIKSGGNRQECSERNGPR